MLNVFVTHPTHIQSLVKFYTPHPKIEFIHARAGTNEALYEPEKCLMTESRRGGVFPGGKRCKRRVTGTKWQMVTKFSWTQMTNGDQVLLTMKWPRVIRFSWPTVLCLFFVLHVNGDLSTLPVNAEIEIFLSRLSYPGNHFRTCNISR